VRLLRGIRGMNPSKPPGNPQASPRKAPGKLLGMKNICRTKIYNLLTKKKITDSFLLRE